MKIAQTQLVARVITAHLRPRDSHGVCHCGKEWNPLHVAKEINKVYLFKAEWPLSMVEINKIVGYLLSLDTRDGVLFADMMNSRMGASARRKAGIDDAPAYSVPPRVPYTRRLS